jgi:CspA family cold shock protein
VVRGTVKRWDDEAGWGLLSSPAISGDVFAHFTHIETEGYATLNEGEEVDFAYEYVPPPGQDGCPYRALRVVRLSS